ncbi:restriction endonuclease subunit S [Weissella paramesenteroides]|uniref:restriction endonuclease subunit S n=2 Tax=Weissella paramesenteroides TaxID=1249 RepID=UPI0023F64FE7|nr:restriction endonuclease subunit S [Weissella paramesenteroides]
MGMQPKLRFKGFTDDWEKRKLESIFKERTERSSEGTMLSVTINDGVVLANSLSRKNVSSSDKSNYKLVRKDDIAYNSMRMWQSASGVSNYEGIVSPAYTVLIPEHDVNSSFFGYYFKRTVMKQVFQKNSQGLTSDTWNLKYPLLKNIVVQIPSIEEQIKISEFLKQVDKLIAVNQRKVDLLKKKKAGYLQKLFPRNGQNKPELRFKGYTDAWEKRKLGDVSSSFEYGLNAASKKFDGKHKYIRITDIDDETHLFSKSNLTSPDINLDKAIEYMLRPNDILFARTGASVGKTYKYIQTDGEVYFAGFLIRATISKDNDVDFIYQHTLTNKYKNFIKVTSQRSGQPGVNAKEFRTFEIMIPKHDEQQKVGDLLKTFDQLITVNQRKVDLLKKEKKSLLQKMFV